MAVVGAKGTGAFGGPAGEIRSSCYYGIFVLWNFWCYGLFSVMEYLMPWNISCDEIFGGPAGKMEHFAYLECLTLRKYALTLELFLEYSIQTSKCMSCR